MNANDFGRIKGNESAKRAALVALVGGHSITFVGPHGCGKHMLAAAMVDLGHKAQVLTLLRCPCGYFTDPRKLCRCTPEAIAAHTRENAGALLTDIHAEVPPLPVSYLFNKRPGTTSATIAEVVKRAQGIEPIAEPLYALSADGERLMKQAYTELGLSMAGAVTAARVADSIRRLSGERAIDLSHIAEAVQYRRLDRVSF